MAIVVLAAAVVAVIVVLGITPVVACPAVAYGSDITVVLRNARIATVVCERGCYADNPVTHRGDGTWSIQPAVPSEASPMTVRGLDAAGREIARNTVDVTVRVRRDASGCTSGIDYSPRAITLG